MPLTENLPPQSAGGFWPGNLNGGADPGTLAMLGLGMGMMAGSPAQGIGAVMQAIGPEAQLARAKLQEAQLQQAVQAFQLKRLQDWDKLVNGSDTNAPPAMPRDPTQGDNVVNNAGQPLSVGAYVAPQDQVGPTLPADAAPKELTQPTGWRFSLPGRSDFQSKAVAQSMTPDAYMKLYAEQSAPQTDITKSLVAANIDPTSAIGRAIILDNIKKQNYIAPTALRSPIYVGSDGLTHVVPADQLEQGYGTQYRAEARGKGDIATKQVWDPSANNGKGGYVLMTESQIADAARGQQAPQAVPPAGTSAPTGPTIAQPAANGAAPGASATTASPDQALTLKTEYTAAQQRLAGARAALNSANGPQAVQQALNAIANSQRDLDGLTRELQRYHVPVDAGPAQYAGAGRGAINPPMAGAMPTAPQTAPQAAGPVMSQPPLGAEAGQNNLQTELSKKWTDLNSMNQQAQTTKSYLDSIKQLAPQAAVGQFADKQQLVNSLLSYAGISEKASDEVTAKNLLDKFSQQIVSRLGGSGGLSTDAARAILQAAYPNSHMTSQAINEAADNLIGANSMIQAKARFLQDAANSRNPTLYNQREIAFDQAADPRIWQWRAIQDPAQRKAFAQQVIKMDPQFPEKIRALEQMGALQ